MELTESKVYCKARLELLGESLVDCNTCQVRFVCRSTSIEYTTNPFYCLPKKGDIVVYRNKAARVISVDFTGASAPWRGVSNLNGMRVTIKLASELVKGVSPYKIRYPDATIARNKQYLVMKDMEKANIQTKIDEDTAKIEQGKLIDI
jgi:hypothetical protein